MSRSDVELYEPSILEVLQLHEERFELVNIRLNKADTRMDEINNRLKEVCQRLEEIQDKMPLSNSLSLQAVDQTVHLERSNPVYESDGDNDLIARASDTEGEFSDKCKL